MRRIHRRAIIVAMGVTGASMIGTAIFRHAQREGVAENLAAPSCSSRFVRSSPSLGSHANIGIAVNTETGFVFANVYAHSRQMDGVGIFAENESVEPSGHFLGALRRWFGEGVYTSPSALTYYVEDTQTGLRIEARYWLEWGPFYGLAPEFRLTEMGDEGEEWEELATESLAAFDACLLDARTMNFETELFCGSTEECGIPVPEPGYPIAMGLRDGIAYQSALPLPRAIDFLLRFANQEAGLEEPSEDEVAAARRAENVMRPLWIWNAAPEEVRRSSPEVTTKIAEYLRGRVETLLHAASLPDANSSRDRLATAAAIYLEEAERAGLLPSDQIQHLQEVTRKAASNAGGESAE